MHRRLYFCNLIKWNSKNTLEHALKKIYYKWHKITAAVILLYQVSRLLKFVGVSQWLVTQKLRKETNTPNWPKQLAIYKHMANYL